MTWLLRSRQLPSVVAVTVLSVFVTIAAAHWYAPFPAIATPAGLGVPVALATPVATGVLVLGSLQSRSPGLEISAARHVTAMDATLLVALLLATAGPLLAAAASTDNTLLLAGARNLAGVVGFGLLLRRWCSPSSVTLIPVVHAAACLTLANRLEPQAWAWLLADPSSPRALLIACALMTTGGIAGLGDAARRRHLQWGEAG